MNHRTPRASFAFFLPRRIHSRIGNALYLGAGSEPLGATVDPREVVCSARGGVLEYHSVISWLGVMYAT